MAEFCITVLIVLALHELMKTNNIYKASLFHCDKQVHVLKAGIFLSMAFYIVRNL